MSSIPKRLQGILWSRNITSLNKDYDKNYIIHQVLAYGTWVHLKWLFKTYKEEEIRNVFKKHPSKDYTEKSFNFVKNILLDIDKGVDEKLYVKTYPRVIR